MKQAFISGSVVYDYIFTIHGRIKDKIVIDKGDIKALDLLFTASDLERRYGGTAGNIAYGLSLLGAEGYIFSVVGKDFDEDYGNYLKKLGIKDVIVRDHSGHTATYYGISDEDQQMIAVFQPNTHSGIGKYQLENLRLDWGTIGVAIFSAGTAESITAQITVVKKLDPSVITILDPGPIINFFPKNLMHEAVKVADIVILNEVETEIMRKRHSLTIRNLFAKGVKAIVRTLAERGAEVITPTRQVIAPGLKMDGILEPTGAGDAFRAGFIYGLLQGFNYIKSAKIGNLVAASSLTTSGGQGYKLRDGLNIL